MCKIEALGEDATLMSVTCIRELLEKFGVFGFTRVLICIR